MNRFLIWFASAVALLVVLWFLASLLFGHAAVLDLLTGLPLRQGGAAAA